MLVCWGTKFANAQLVDLFDQITKSASVPPRQILLTDHMRPDMPRDIQQVIMDPYYLRAEFMGGGAQAKLTQFVKGALPSNIPTVYVDIDTVVLGDLYQLVRALKDPSQFLMLGNSALTLGRAARLVANLSKGRLRSRGNSSLMCYLPAQFHHAWP